MDGANEVERVRGLSDDELLAGLQSAVGSTRRWTARVLAHLGEVKDRRLQLLAGYGSMFDYCTRGLGMSEDEACRRIEVARLARQFPILFERLADGSLSLSVAALLKARLTDANHVALVAAVSSKTVFRAREVLAVWFPQPDVPASIRKLPERRSSTSDATERVPKPGQGAVFAATHADLSSASMPPMSPNMVQELAPATGEGEQHDMGTPRVAADAPRSGPAPEGSVSSASAPNRPMASTAAEPSTTERPAPSQPPLAHRARSSFKPLSHERYRVQLTASAELKRKLELARDLLRHAVPGGDLADIIERALDLLIEKALARRFGKLTRKKNTGASPTTLDDGRHPQREPSTTNLPPTTDAPASPPSPAMAPSTTPPPASESSTPQSPTMAQSLAAASSPATASSPAMTPSPPAASSPATASPHAMTPSPPAASSPPAVSSSGIAPPSATPLPAMAPPSATPPLPAMAPPSATPPPSMPPAMAPSSAAPNLPPNPPLPAIARPSATPPLPAMAAPDTSRRPHLPNEVRRAVSERDGLQCTWRGPDGVRCESRAWLEHDHIIPLGLGGTDEPSNIRIRCRAHNRLSAEQAFGQASVARSIVRRRARRRICRTKSAEP